MKLRYVDAHNHLHDKRLGANREDLIAQCAAIGVVASVVNGTSPEDWSAVTELAERYAWIIPSYGVHPWYVDTLQEGWLRDLKRLLLSRPSLIGEIGLDHWKEGLDRDAQEEVFLEQLQLAIELDRPVSIHGLKAWGRLLALLRSHGVPKAGFLLHSYSGPSELVTPFVELGAYFSCASAVFAPSRAKQLDCFSVVPLRRLLPETDAPDQALPQELDEWPLRDGDGKPLNHPAAIATVYRKLAAFLSIDEIELAETLERNFKKLFSPKR